MKRLLGLLLALALLPILAAPPASAACPYTTCPFAKTVLTAPAAVPQGTRPVLRVKVTVSGNAKPVGRVTVVVRKRGGGYSWTRTVAVSGEKSRSVRLSRLTKRGRYLVTARFDPRPDTIWRASSAAKTFRVVRKP